MRSGEVALLAAPGAPNKAALEYFPKMVNFYEDDKIFDLLDEYGPLGVTVYDCILTIVYSNGYFANLSKDKLSRMVIRKIGNKWIKSQKVVVQVIDYCADLGLLCNDLMLQNIITSVGIQKRYYKIAVKLMKRQLYSKEYWLLDENGEPFLSEPKTSNDSEEKVINSEEINHDSEEIPQKEKETKQNKTKNNRVRKYVSDSGLNKAIQDFVDYRKKVGKPMTDRAMELMLNKLSGLSGDVGDQIKILNQSIVNGWAGIYELKDKKTSQNDKQSAPNRFHNFNQRSTDYDAMVQQQTVDWLQQVKEEKQDES